MEAMKKPSHHIGSFLAQIQDTCDLLAQWAFGKLKSASKDVQKESHPVAKTFGKVGTFLGEVGDTFYKEYERIKSDRKEKEDK